MAQRCAKRVQAGSNPRGKVRAPCNRKAISPIRQRGRLSGTARDETWRACVLTRLCGVPERNEFRWVGVGPSINQF